MLVVAATALIALAATFADHDALAVVFALGGVALVIVGVMLPRVQGQFEFSPTGFKLFLAELEIQTSDLSPEAKADVLDAIVDVGSDIEKVGTSAGAGRRLAAAVAANASAEPRSRMRWRNG